MSFCSNCGSKLVMASKFCSSCGVDIPTSNNNDTNEQNKPKHPRIDANTKKVVHSAKPTIQTEQPSTHKSFSLSPVDTQSFSKKKKILVGCLSLIILITGYITLSSIPNSPTTSKKELTNDEKNAIRFKTLLPQLDKDADIHKDISEELLAELIVLININGYKCDTVTFAMPFIRKHGYSLTCNNYRYSYEIEDKGGNFIVTVK